MLSAPYVLGEEQNARPGINDYYLADPDYQQWVRVFESPGREVYDKRKTIINALDLQSILSQDLKGKKLGEAIFEYRLNYLKTITQTPPVYP